MKNCFPCVIMERVVNNYLCKFFNHHSLPRDEQTKKGSTLFFKLPFTGPFSAQPNAELRLLLKKGTWISYKLLYLTS